MSHPVDSGGFDVFLSHASPDKPWVIRLAEELAALGLRVFLDRDELRPVDTNLLTALLASLFRSGTLTATEGRARWGEASPRLPDRGRIEA
jgi:hypothetical protein